MMDFIDDMPTVADTMEYVTFPTTLDLKLETVLRLGIIATDIRATSLLEVIEHIITIHYEDYIEE